MSVDVFVSVDWEVIELVLHDGLTNAQKYGHLDKASWVEAWVDESSSELVVDVCSIAHPQSPDMTDEKGVELLQGGKGESYVSGVESVDASLRTSDGIGISNALKAVECLHGHLKLHQEKIDDERVTKFEIRVPCKKANPPISTAG